MTIIDNYKKLFVVAHKNAAHCIGEQNKTVIDLTILVWVLATSCSYSQNNT